MENQNDKKVILRLAFEFITEDGEKCRPNINNLNCLEIPLAAMHNKINFRHGFEVSIALVDALIDLYLSPETNFLFSQIQDTIPKGIAPNELRTMIAKLLNPQRTNCEISIRENIHTCLRIPIPRSYNSWEIIQEYAKISDKIVDSEF